MSDNTRISESSASSLVVSTEKAEDGVSNEACPPSTPNQANKNSLSGLNCGQAVLIRRRGEDRNESSKGVDECLVIEVGEASDIGWRPYQEDRSHWVLEEDHVFLAIFDGHGSAEFAEHSRSNLYNLLTSSPSFGTDKPVAIREAFLAEDEKLLHVSTEGHEGGTTASVVVIDSDFFLHSGNVGDSRTVLAERIDANFGPGCLVSPRGNQGLESGIQNVDTDTEWKAWRLTRDHVPKDEAEKKRIEESGGAILRDRVLGVVNITRALGDHPFKFPFNRDVVTRSDVSGDFLSAAPHISTIELTKGLHEFVIIASDGLWNSVDELRAVRVVAETRDAGGSSLDAAKALINAAAENRGGSGGDNVTVVVAFLVWDDERQKVAIERNREQSSTSTLSSSSL